MKKQIDIVVPTHWSAVSLKKYLKIQRDIENHKGDDEAVDAHLFFHLTGIGPDIKDSIDGETYQKIRNDLYSFLGDVNFELQRIITIDGKEYGFEPNLSKMAYGAYLDLTQYKDFTIGKDWKNIMTILYRPVTKKIGALYEIEPYDGFKEWETIKWEDVGMDVHFGCFFLFKNILKTLQLSTLNSLKKKGNKHNSELILERSGELIKLLHSYQETPYSILKGY